MSSKEMMAELERRRAEAALGGGADRIAKQHDHIVGVRSRHRHRVGSSITSTAIRGQVNVHFHHIRAAQISYVHDIGASDRIGALPIANPVSPPDIAATMFAALGVDPSGHYTDATGRPFPITTGQPILALYG